MAILLSTLGCIGRISDRPIETSTQAMGASHWCSVMKVKWHGRDRTVIACTEEAFCVQAVEQIRKRGSLVGVTSLSACEWME